jgi:hypothetical protein
MASIVREHHFNRDRPEDMNVYISNNKDNVGRYHDGETWCQTRADHLVWDIFDRYRDFVDAIICDTLTDTEDEERSTLKESLLKQFKNAISKWESRTAKPCFEERAQYEIRNLLCSKADLVFYKQLMVLSCPQHLLSKVLHSFRERG